MAPEHESLAAGGVRASLRLWDALAADDDITVERLLTADALAIVGTSDGIAQRLRDHLGIERELCRHIGYLADVALLIGGRVRPTFTLAAERCIHGVTAPIPAWQFEALPSEGGWLVDPTCVPVEFALRLVEVPLERLG